jgi:hypothetical protein
LEKLLRKIGRDTISVMDEESSKPVVLGKEYERYFIGLNK